MSMVIREKTAIGYSSCSIIGIIAYMYNFWPSRDGVKTLNCIKNIQLWYPGFLLYLSSQ